MKNQKNLTIISLILVFSFLAFPSWAIHDDVPAPDNTVTDIFLFGTGSKIEWEAIGYSGKGFKVVWSLNSGPTYPTRSGDKYHYYSMLSTCQKFYVNFYILFLLINVSYVYIIDITQLWFLNIDAFDVLHVK